MTEERVCGHGGTVERCPHCGTEWALPYQLDVPYVESLRGKVKALRAEKEHLWELLNKTRREADELAAEVHRLGHELTHARWPAGGV